MRYGRLTYSMLKNIFSQCAAFFLKKSCADGGVFSLNGFFSNKFCPFCSGGGRLCYNHKTCGIHIKPMHKIYRITEFLRKLFIKRMSHISTALHCNSGRFIYDKNLLIFIYNVYIFHPMYNKTSLIFFRHQTA